MAVLRTYAATVNQLGPLFHWRFNEGTGTVATDRANDLDGTYQGGVSLGQAGTIGDGAADFDSASDLMRVSTLGGTLRVAVLGDSLTDPDGDFQPEGEEFADDFEAALEGLGIAVTYFDHAVSGETTAEGLARLSEVTADTPDVVIVELGTNDAGAERAPPEVEADLRAIIEGLQVAGIEHILITGAFGFHPGHASPGYATEELRDQFEAIFPAVAEDLAVTLLDADGNKFLGGTREGEVITGGVLGDDALNAEGLHPNAAGVDVIVPRIVPQTVGLGVNAGTVTEPFQLSEGTIEVWCNADTISGTRIILSKNATGEGEGGHFAIGLQNGQARFVLGDATTNHIAQSAEAVIAAGQATHLVVTFGAAGMLVFVNGQQVASNVHAGGLAGNFEQFVVGGDAGSIATLQTPTSVNAPFDGTVDEVAVYGHALNQAGIATLFQAGASGSTLVGTAENDTLRGGDDDDIMTGRGGDDIVRGFAGNDTLRGGADDDDLSGGVGNDVIFGGAGIDAMLGGAGNDVVSGGPGPDAINGGPGDDQLFGDGGRDLLIGSIGSDFLDGGGANDTLRGAAGIDQLFGRGGADSLGGGRGADILNGGPGRDALTGGAGADTFRIAALSHGLDTVADFTPEDGDVLDISAVLQGFGDGSSPADFVTLREVGNATRVGVNADGAGNDRVDVFNLLGATGLNLNQLVEDGNIALT